MTTTSKPERISAAEEAEDMVLRNVFMVSLVESTDSRFEYLEPTAVDLLREGKELLLSLEVMVSVLVSRLEESLSFPATRESTFCYLVDCYGRAKKLCALYDLDDDPFEDSKCPLLPLIYFEVGWEADGIRPPDGFLDDFLEGGDLDAIYRRLFDDLREDVKWETAMGDFRRPLDALAYLARFPAGQKSLVTHEKWLVEEKNGSRGGAVEVEGYLGPFFHISALQSEIKHLIQLEISLPYMEMLLDAAKSGMMEDLCDGLRKVLFRLLKNEETRGRSMEFLAQVIDTNSRRACLQVDPRTCASSGMFVNLSMVMLRLCQPWLDGRKSGMYRADPRYVLLSERLDFSRLTALNASSEERSSLAEELRAKKAGTSEYPLACELFFMTARVLHLGLLKAISEYKDILLKISECKASISELRNKMKEQPGDLDDLEMAYLEGGLKSYSYQRECYKAQALDEDLIRRALSFYRVMLVWLESLGRVSAMPVSPPCPLEFAAMPEHFVEDAMDMLIYASKFAPSALQVVPVGDFITFIVMFMACPGHIRNPSLRAKMARALKTLARYYKGFEGHALSEHLVRNLLNLYVDNHEALVRYDIAELLGHLCDFPSYRSFWRRIGEEENRKTHLSFLNSLLDDTTHLLDEGLEGVLQLRALEAEMSKAAEWEERLERTRLLQSVENSTTVSMVLADENVNLMFDATKWVASSFLSPEMIERVATTLNYFTQKLVGPLRESLGLENPQKYNFDPTWLLQILAAMYINLSGSDKGEAFPAAISAEGRSYSDQLFDDAAAELRRIGTDERIVERFVQLGERVKAAAEDALRAESALGEVPDKYLDPLQYTLMKDPVSLPSSRVVVDRAVILRHLLRSCTDPFNRAYLTPDMLVPDDSLKAEIEEFVRTKLQR